MIGSVETPIKVGDAYLLDQATGKKLKIHPGTVEISWSDKLPDQIDIHHSYNFECSFKVPPFTVGVKELFEESAAWRHACRLADKLNDLIEEYHAPGTPRRERRSIKREFDKTFIIFHKHCKQSCIAYRYVSL